MSAAYDRDRRCLESENGQLCNRFVAGSYRGHCGEANESGKRTQNIQLFKQITKNNSNINNNDDDQSYGNARPDRMIAGRVLNA